MTVYMFLYYLWAQAHSNELLLLLLATLSVVYIYCHAPAEQSNWILNLRQKMNYQKVGRKSVLISWGLGMAFLFYQSSIISKSIFMILILSGVNLFLKKHKSIHKDILTLQKPLKFVVAAVLSFGVVSIHGACGHWNYQPVMDANIRKYLDN